VWRRILVTAALCSSGALGAALGSAGVSGQAGARVDPTRLPLGDGHVASAEQAGSVWPCATRFGGGGAFRAGDWIHEDGTFDFTPKPSVDGRVSWPSRFDIAITGGVRRLTGNELPAHATGAFPIARDDDAYQFDRNPNSIRAQNLLIDLPLDPTPAAHPSCVPVGPIGVMLSGAVLFNALDALGHDAVAHEMQDGCQGHPERSGTYHYHSLTTCLDDGGTGHSRLVGYAFDGFGIFGRRGGDGRVLQNGDLDACHGHTHEIDWDGRRVVMYHYHATWEYPYTVGCYRGTPVYPPLGGRGRASE
jgi:YHYH protein